MSKASSHIQEDCSIAVATGAALESSLGGSCPLRLRRRECSKRNPCPLSHRSGTHHSACLANLLCLSFRFLCTNPVCAECQCIFAKSSEPQLLLVCTSAIFLGQSQRR